MHIVTNTATHTVNSAQEHFARAIDFYSVYGKHLSGISDLAIGLYALSVQLQRIETKLGDQL